jgi:hypothetical protein
MPRNNLKFIKFLFIFACRKSKIKVELKSDNGKPREIWGRKATGAKVIDHASQLPKIHTA